MIVTKEIMDMLSWATGPGKAENKIAARFEVGMVVENDIELRLLKSLCQACPKYRAGMFEPAPAPSGAGQNQKKQRS